MAAFLGPARSNPGAFSFEKGVFRMRRTGILAALACLASLSIAAGPGAGLAQAAPLHLVDDQGSHLTLRGPVTRIVCLGPSNAQILLALGLRKDIVGMDDESVTYDPQPYRGELKGIEVVGDSYSGLNVEKIADLHPGLVLAMQGVKNMAELKALSLPVATLDPANLEGIYRDIRFVGAATGSAKRAQALVASLQARLAAVRKAVAPLRHPSVYVELDPTQYYTAGPGSFLDTLVRLAGGQNIADRVTKSSYPALSGETIIAQNPAYIVLLDTPGASRRSVAARPGWSGIAAVREGHVVANIDPSLLSEPAPAIVEGVEELARDLHPGHRIP